LLFLLQVLRTVSLTSSLTLFLLVSLVTQSWSAPKASFQRRNWSPQAMLYLKGTHGRAGRLITGETRSQNTEKLSVDQAATILLNFLQQAREGGESRSR
uniref:Spexin hormone n=1 Tax=Salarias fasciatus TaxID=181472 RepID=A0A672IK85_SALFA